MSFRDDRDALQAKKEALEEQLERALRELDTARPRLQRVEELEAELAAAKEELSRFTAPHARGQAVKRRRLVLLGAVSAVALAATLSTVFVVRQGRRARYDHNERARLMAVAERQRLEALERARRARLQGEAAQAAQAEREAVAAQPPPEPFYEGTGRVVEVDGPAPTARGASCEVTLAPAGRAAFEARLRVRCGGRTVYGRPGFGYLRGCDLADGVPERCEDRNGSGSRGDPMVVLDLPTRTLVVSDGPELPWTARIELDSP